MPVKNVRAKSNVIPSETRNLKTKKTESRDSSSDKYRTQNDKIPKSKKSDTLSIPVYSLAGREVGSLVLPKEVFGKEVNERGSSAGKKLLAQAIRVYTTNQKMMTASTKSRGEVKGTTAKVWRQKGTGRARHGARTAPIFVGGGVAFGPKPRKVELKLPQKMKRAALLQALSSKAQDKQIMGLAGVEKSTGKTSQMAKLFAKLNIKSVLVVTGDKIDNVVRSIKNIPQAKVLPVNLLNAYEILKHKNILLTKEAVEKLGGKKDA